MSSSAAIPAVLDEFAAAVGEIASVQRDLARRVERAVAALPGRPPAVGGVPVPLDAGLSLQRLAGWTDDLAVEIVSVSRSFRAADRVLLSLTGAAGAAVVGGVGSVKRIAGISGQRGPEVSRSFNGENGSVEAGVHVGDKWAAEFGAGIADWKATIAARAEYFAGARAYGQAAAAVGIATAAVSAEASVGVSVEGEAALSIGRDGVHAEAGGEARIGAEVEGDATVEVAGVTATAHGGATVGFAATADAEADFNWDKVGVRFEIGLAVLVGLEGGVTVAFSPREALNDLADLGGKGIDAAGGVAETVGEGAKAVGGGIKKGWGWIKGG